MIDFVSTSRELIHAMRRRSFLKYSVLTSAAGIQASVHAGSPNIVGFRETLNLASSRANQSSGNKKCYASAAKNSLGEYSAQIFSSEGRILQNIGLPKRGHSFAVQPTLQHQQFLLCIGRRPGNYFLAIDLLSENVVLP